MDAPQLVTTEIPEEVARMEAALLRERQERAAQAARDAQIAAAINEDIFCDARPVSDIDAGEIKELDIDVNLNMNADIMDQNVQLYDVEAAHTRDPNGRHFWSFDDRRRMPLLVIAFRSTAGHWLCIVNDVLMPLQKFLNIAEAQAAPVQRREFGAPPGLPSTDQLLCVTATGEKITIPHASVAQLMKALHTVPTSPEN